MDRGDAVDVTRRILPTFLSEREHLQRIDDYLHGKHARPYRPPDADREYRAIEARSVSNWLPLVIKAVAQTLFVDGYRSADADDDSAPWRYWQANGFDARQAAVHRAGLTFGNAYTVVLPGDPVPVIRGHSPRKMLAVYDDQAADDWPRFALRAETSTVEGQRHLMMRLYDDADVHHLSSDPDGDNVAWIESRRHGLGVVPVVRFPCELDLDGRYTGELAPLIPGQDRINQVTFDTNMVLSFGSFVIRTISGMSLPESESEARRKKLQMAMDRFLVGEDPDIKFGSIPATPPDGYLKARDQAVHDLAAQSQTPPHHLLGGMANLSAEALAAAESSLMRKALERRQTFGEAWEQTLRLSALAAGDRAGWEDYESQVQWRDTEARSLSQTVDALGKAAEMLKLPVEMLWPRIPGFTKTDVEEAKALHAAADPMARMVDRMQRQSEPGGDPDAD